MEKKEAVSSVLKYLCQASPLSCVVPLLGKSSASCLLFFMTSSNIKLCLEEK